jgi:hypothetical protein
MVEIPNYSGPPLNDLMEGHGQKSLIAAVTLSCDANCHCKRKMFPVVPGKADSVYCLQGLTAGDNKSIERVLLHWTCDAEARWPNILYVGASRAEDGSNFALKMTFHYIKYDFRAVKPLQIMKNKYLFSETGHVLQKNEKMNCFYCTNRHS